MNVSFVHPSCAACIKAYATSFLSRAGDLMCMCLSPRVVYICCHFCNKKIDTLNIFEHDEHNGPADLVTSYNEFGRIANGVRVRCVV